MPRDPQRFPLDDRLRMQHMLDASRHVALRRGPMCHNHDDNMKIDYEQTVSYFLSLQDVRFKILAFMPILVGAALATLSDEDVEPVVELLGALLGSLVTLGLMSYDQRNTQIYDRLVTRAKFLERQLGLEKLPLVHSQKPHGGAFHSRPPLKWRIWKRGITIFPVWHTLGLAVVYGACLMTWGFMGLHALYRDDTWRNWPWLPLLNLLPVILLLLWVITASWLSNHNHRVNETNTESKTQ